MKSENLGLSGCLFFLALFFVCLWWQVFLPLIVIGSMLTYFYSLKTQSNASSAKDWLVRHNSQPCCISGMHGIIDGLLSDAEGLTLLVRPIEVYREGCNPIPKSYSAKWIGWSFNQTLGALFKEHSVSILRGVSVEKTSIEAALRCQSELTWCINSLIDLTKMLDQVERALVLSNGNRLLEPSVPKFLEIKKRIAEEGLKIVTARDETSQMLEDIVEYLSVPVELRQSTEIDVYGYEASARFIELKSSFNFLVDFNEAYINLSE